jgi:hypothetical protein
MISEGFKRFQRHIHETTLHSFAQTTWATALNQMWCPKMFTLVRRTNNDCTVCRSFNLKTLEEIMAPLPGTRLNPSRPFVNISIDYFGPIKVQPINQGDYYTTLYGFVAICHSTKAIAIEWSQDQTVATIISTSKQLSSQHGYPKTILSDSAPAFQAI